MFVKHYAKCLGIDNSWSCHSQGYIAAMYIDAATGDVWAATRTACSARTNSFL